MLLCSSVSNWWWRKSENCIVWKQKKRGFKVGTSCGNALCMLISWGMACAFENIKSWNLMLEWYFVNYENVFLYRRSQGGQLASRSRCRYMTLKVCVRHLHNRAAGQSTRSHRAYNMYMRTTAFVCATRNHGSNQRTLALGPVIIFQIHSWRDQQLARPRQLQPTKGFSLLP